MPHRRGPPPAGRRRRPGEQPRIAADDAGRRRRRRTADHRAAAGGRAGRNLGAAIGVGLSLGAVILASLLLWRPAFVGVVTAAMLVGVVELTRALRAGRFRAPLVPLLVGALAMEGAGLDPRRRPAWSSASCSPCSPSSSGGSPTGRSAT